MSKLLEKASDLVNQIHACMRNIETCEGITEVVKDLPLAFINEKNEATHLDGVVTEEQMIELRQTVLNAIDKNRTDAEGFLRVLTGEDIPEEPAALEDDEEEDQEEEEIPLPAGVEVEPEPQKRKPATINQEFEDAIEDMVKSSKKEVKQPVVLDKAEVKRLYLDEGMTLVEVADILGTNKSTLHKFITANGLKRPKKGDDVFRDAKKVQKK